MLVTDYLYSDNKFMTILFHALLYKMHIVLKMHIVQLDEHWLVEFVMNLC
jgi:hypothetical protein